MTCCLSLASAIADADYGMANMDLTFPTNSGINNTQCLDVTITEDTVLEGAETFTVTLTTADTVVMLGNNEITVTIIDNEGSSA